MTLIDQIELDVLEDTGDVVLAERLGLAVVLALDSIADLITYTTGSGEWFRSTLKAIYT